MDALKYIFYEDNGVWIGWLEDYPDYRTQGATREELEANLRDILDEVTSGTIPCVRQVGTLDIP